MPVITWQPNPEQSQAFQAGLGLLTQLKRVSSQLTVNPNPLPIYNLGARDVTAGTDIGAAGKLAGWRYYATDASAARAVSGDLDSSSTPRVTKLSYGPDVWEIWKRIEALGAGVGLPENGMYEPCLLRIPGLLIEAFWFRPRMQSGGAADSGWVVPYHTLLKDLDPLKLYSVNEFLAKIVPAAQKALMAE